MGRSGGVQHQQWMTAQLAQVLQRLQVDRTTVTCQLGGTYVCLSRLSCILAHKLLVAETTVNQHLACLYMLKHIRKPATSILKSKYRTAINLEDMGCLVCNICCRCLRLESTLDLVGGIRALKVLIQQALQRRGVHKDILQDLGRQVGQHTVLGPPQYEGLHLHKDPVLSTAPCGATTKPAMVSGNPCGIGAT